MDSRSSGSAAYGTESGRHEGTTLTDAAVRLWPTPAASVPNDHEEPEVWRERQARERTKGQNGNGMGVPLSIAAKERWGTPLACERAHSPRDVDHGVQLANQVAAWPTHRPLRHGDYRDRLPGEAPSDYWNRMRRHEAEHPEEVLPRLARWPTPTTAPEARNLGSNQANSPASLGEAARWATLCARDGKGATLFDSGHRHGPGLPDQATALGGPPSSSEPRTLNPLFVEWLMGLPLGYSSPGELTDFDHSVTRSSPRKRRSRSASSPGGPSRE